MAEQEKLLPAQVADLLGLGRMPFTNDEVELILSRIKEWNSLPLYDPRTATPQQYDASMAAYKRIDEMEEELKTFPPHVADKIRRYTLDKRGGTLPSGGYSEGIIREDIL